MNEMSDSPFKLLFTPIQVGKLTLRNRIVFLPHSNHFAFDGFPRERAIHYFTERAKGGVGLIICRFQDIYDGHFLHHISGGAFIDATNPRIVEQYKRIADKVHEHGAHVMAQLAHVGSSPHGVSKFGLDWVTPQQIATMSHGHIKRAIEGYVQAARRVVAAGFDGIEIRLHGHLGGEFTSPLTNKRTDEYGGTVENRLRFGLEVIHAVRQEVGPDLLMGARICVDEATPRGYGVEGGQEIARIIAATGQVDLLSATFGSTLDSSSDHLNAAPYPLPPGYAVDAAAELKKVVGIPVIAAGRIIDPIQAEAILAEGKADLIGMARGLFADPEFPNKAREGRTDDIRKCLGYHDVCHGNREGGGPITCVWNPSMGREKQLGIGTLRQARRKKKVLVVGGGPAGLKVAEVAARRGHQVTLYDKGEELGGQINLAIRLPFRDHLGEISSHLSNQLEKLGVDIKKRVEVTPEMVMAANPDVLVVATGSIPFIPDIPGVHQDNVVTYWDVARDGGVKGQSVLIYDGVGHWAAGSIVELLAGQGKRVHMVTPHRTILSLTSYETRYLWEQRIAGKDIVRITEHNVRAIRDGTVTLANSLDTGEERIIEGIDTVVLAYGGTPNDTLYQALKDKLKAVRMVGDCEVPLRIERVMYSAELLGRAL
jgi:2,4-dienoyl-CoA reductase-like NADH-dependent reductase (Old Yellow Enzyme family)/thioredoxin reductase